ncbi:flavodoxin family protein [Candidatus Lokiarchaeum ossiferum]|uniref:flavodoxin family protein n=1 Tax=Candidatus Lokiarchaeum ossiferum TaxID=2951803 RepID=UPI00352F2F30
MSVHTKDDTTKKKLNTLVVYYSLTNTTKTIAETIQKELSCDILRIKPKKSLNPNGNSKFVWGGMQATMHAKPKIESHNLDLSKYDLIFIGTPVWAWTFTPPIRTFLAENDLHNKNVALWTCAGGSDEKALSRFKKQVKGCNLIDGMKIIQPADNNPESNIKKTIEWVKSIKSGFIIKGV